MEENSFERARKAEPTKKDVLSCIECIERRIKDPQYASGDGAITFIERDGKKYVEGFSGLFGGDFRIAGELSEYEDIIKKYHIELVEDNEEKEMKSVESEILAPLDCIKSPDQFIQKISDIYVNFDEIDNYLRNACSQEQDRITANQTNDEVAQKKYAKKMSQKVYHEESMRMWGHNFAPNLNLLLEVLKKEGEKKFPELDWNKIGNAIIFHEDISNAPVKFERSK